MTNVEILATECALRNITEEVHTFAKWKSMGKVVKKGEHALFDTQLWKATKRKNKKTDEEEDRMYMCRAYLFGEHQVEDIKEVK